MQSNDAYFTLAYYYETCTLLTLFAEANFEADWLSIAELKQLF